MDNQHRQITGFADLSQEEINVINQIKAAEASVAAVYFAVSTCVAVRGAPDTRHRDAARQVSIARTEFESAFFRLVRSIACPESPWIEAPAEAPTPAPTKASTPGLLLEVRTVGMTSASPPEHVEEAAARKWADDSNVARFPTAEVFDGENFVPITHGVLDDIKARYLMSLHDFDVIEGKPVT